MQILIKARMIIINKYFIYNVQVVFILNILLNRPFMDTNLRYSIFHQISSFYDHFLWLSVVGTLVVIFLYSSNFKRLTNLIFSITVVKAQVLL